jgi:sugar-specific transcriptional regulator TrmB
MDKPELLKTLGFSAKEADVYLTVLSGGPDSVRAIAVKAAVNRGTAYEILKSLVAQGAVSYYNKEKKQYFVAEPPEKLMNVLSSRIESLEKSKDSLEEALPELKSLYDSGGTKPTVKLYEGESGVRTILEDVLETCADLGEKAYVAYSAAGLRDALYESFPGFTKERIRRGVFVRVIALGGGGQEAELAERRWLTKKKEGAPTYTLIYGGKVAAVSFSPSRKPQAVLIEDAAIADTQRIIFEYVWNSGLHR